MTDMLLDLLIIFKLQVPSLLQQTKEIVVVIVFILL
jgi:hypothetical protein